MQTKRVINNKIRGSIAPLLSLLMVVLYLAGTSHLELLHTFVHHHDVSTLHSAEKEEDACHRLIYHNDKENGCHHDSHMTGTDDCQMCDLAYHGDHNVLSNPAFLTPLPSTQEYNLYKQNLDSYWAVISSSRGPPTRA